MMFRKAATVGGIFLSLAVSIHESPARAEDGVKTAYESQVGYALHLLEAGRYGEAADAAQNLVTAYPDAALPYELRGATALYVGGAGRAQVDFARAASADPQPSALYGLALAALLGGKVDAAREALTKAALSPGLTPAQGGGLQTARAYVQMLGGDAQGALAMASPGASDPVRQEVIALATFRADPKAGATLLSSFLATPGGVPRVREEDGLRPLFDPVRPLEPCVVEPDLQQMYADRMGGASADAARRTGTVQACSGTADLTPPDVLPARTALLSYAVDGQVAAMVNQPPYRFSWNTRRVANGTHTVRLEAVDANGNTLLTQTETVRVSNAGGEVARQADADPATVALKTRLWNLLRLRPSLKVAEWTLAQYDLSQKDLNGADAHLANAAALDPSYKNGRRFARALFGTGTSPITLWYGDPRRRQVALTFDDGPSAQKTPALLDALDSAHAPATFFVVGSRAELAPDLLRRMARRGDEVENHSYTHPNMNLVIPAVAEGELLRASVLIQSLTGHQPRFFRPPGGNADPSVQRLARLYGLSLGYWTVDALHAEDVGSSQGLVRYVLTHVHPGSIVLMHNGPDVTTQALPALVAALRAQGYTLVTLSQIAQGQKSGAKPAALPKIKE